MDGGAWNSCDAPVTRNDIASVARSNPIPLSEDMLSNLTGAGFFGDLWSGIKSGAKTVYNAVKPTVTTIANQALTKYAPQAIQYAQRALGAGRKGMRRGRGLFGYSEGEEGKEYEDISILKKKQRRGSIRGGGFIDDRSNPVQEAEMEKESLPFPDMDTDSKQSIFNELRTR